MADSPVGHHARRRHRLVTAQRLQALAAAAAGDRFPGPGLAATSAATRRPVDARGSTSWFGRRGVGSTAISEWTAVRVSPRGPLAAQPTNARGPHHGRRRGRFRLQDCELLTPEEEQAALPTWGRTCWAWTGRRRRCRRPTRPSTRPSRTSASGRAGAYVRTVYFLRGLHPRHLSATSPTRRPGRAGAAVSANPTTGRQITTGDAGTAAVVYGGQGRPCLRCGTPFGGSAGSAGRVATGVPPASRRGGTEESVRA